jgi:hypothetical protein
MTSWKPPDVRDKEGLEGNRHRERHRAIRDVHAFMRFESHDCMECPLRFPQINA